MKATKQKLFENSELMSDPFLSPEQAAKFLGVSRKFIYERIQRKEIEAQPIGRLKRIRRSTIEAWLTRQKNWR